MTIERSLSSPTPSTATAAVTDPWAAVRTGDWRAFSFPTGHFLLHIPSSHVLDVPLELAEQARGERADPAAQAELDRLASVLPRPVARPVTPDIRSLSLNMAQGCNLRCTYCFAGEGDYGSKGLMSFAVAVKAIETLAAGKKNFHLVFFGGEPMLNFSVIQQVVAWCEAQSATAFSYSITTNGTLLTPEKLAWLTTKRFAMNLSYDGPGLHAQQRLNKDKKSNSEALVERKMTAFAAQLAALQEFRLRATVTKENLPLLEEAMIETLTTRNFRLFFAHQDSTAARQRFNEADIAHLGDVLHRVVDRLLATGDFAKLLKIDNLRQAIRMIHRGKTGGMACGAGVNYLTASVSGGFYLCHRFNEDESERVGGIDTGLDQAKLADIAAFRAAKKAPCNTCWMREWCAGGCFHAHKSSSGDKYAIDPRYCQLQDLEMREAMRVYTVLLQQAPQLLEG